MGSLAIEGIQISTRVCAHVVRQKLCKASDKTRNYFIMRAHHMKLMFFWMKARIIGRIHMMIDGDYYTGQLISCRGCVLQYRNMNDCCTVKVEMCDKNHRLK